MMDFEFKLASDKLEKEQKARKEAARLKVERERRVREEARRQREAIEVAQRCKRLDEIKAELQVEEQTWERATNARGISFTRVLEAVPFEGKGDKIILPTSCFKDLTDQGAFDKGPLYFRLLAHPGHSLPKETHSGVLEFTEEEGHVGLPPHVWDNLFSSTVDTPVSHLVEVSCVWLPKGVYAKLRQHDFSFSEIPDHRAVLEAALRHHTTLSEGDVITVKHGNAPYKLGVVELKPSLSVSALETDIEVDIVGLDPTSLSTQTGTLSVLNIGSSQSTVFNEGSYRYYKFIIDDITWEKIASDKNTLEIKLDIDGPGDADLYVSKHPLMFPNRYQHEWSSHDTGSKVLHLCSVDKSFGVGTFSIGVYGFLGTAKCNLSVTVQSKSTFKTGQESEPASSSAHVDRAECTNCRRAIPACSLALHDAYCRRHNVVCQHPGCGLVIRLVDAVHHSHCERCGKPLRPEEMEKHMKVFHEPLLCSCGVKLEKEQMVEHQVDQCPVRLITCRFCGDLVKAGRLAIDIRDRLMGLSEHESMCGSRTAPCTSCGRFIMLKEMQIHQIAVHQDG